MNIGQILGKYEDLIWVEKIVKLFQNLARVLHQLKIWQNAFQVQHRPRPSSQSKGQLNLSCYQIIPINLSSCQIGIQIKFINIEGVLSIKCSTCTTALTKSNQIKSNSTQIKSNQIKSQMCKNWTCPTSI